MFSIPMALPAHLLKQLPPGVIQGLPEAEGQADPSARLRARALPLGLHGLDECLPDHGLLRGAVVELAVTARTSLATSVALAACRAAQQEGVQQGGSSAWCAFIDTTGTLYAPGVARAGVVLDRLLVVRPAPEALARTALRIVEARAFAVVAIDLVGVPGASFGATPGHVGTAVPLGPWARIVRRLALAVENTQATILLVTDASAHRAMPLPVAMRVELSRREEARLSVRIAKDQRGRISPLRSLAWG